jgi:AcrR family transcriptional regulator
MQQCMDERGFLQSAPMPASSAAAAPRKARPRPDADAQRAALTPERWIEAATEVLVDQGIDHVRVDVLATQLGVTRGSFYWHFKDREELLRAVLASWRESATIALTQRLEQAQADPRQQLRDVLSLPFRGRAAARAARIELAIRAWARRDTMARYAVDEADAARLAHIAQIFSSMGFSLTEARARAVMAYGLVVAESLAPKLDTLVQREWRNTYIEQLLAHKPA